MRHPRTFVRDFLPGLLIIAGAVAYGVTMCHMAERAVDHAWNVTHTKTTLPVTDGTR